MPIFQFRDSDRSMSSINIHGRAELAFFQTDGTTIYMIGTDYAVRYSEATGGIEMAIAAATETVNCFLLLQGGRLLIATATSGIFTSDDNGVSWTNRSATVIIGCDTDDNGQIVATRQGADTFVSQDNGTTWAAGASAGVTLISGGQNVRYYPEINTYYVLGFGSIAFSTDGAGWTSFAIATENFMLAQTLLGDTLYIGSPFIPGGGITFKVPKQGGTETIIEDKLFYPTELYYGDVSGNSVSFAETIDGQVYFLSLFGELQVLNNTLDIFEPIPIGLAPTSFSTLGGVGILKYKDQLWAAFGEYLVVENSRNANRTF